MCGLRLRLRFLRRVPCLNKKISSLSRDENTSRGATLIDCMRSPLNSLRHSSPVRLHACPKVYGRGSVDAYLATKPAIARKRYRQTCLSGHSSQAHSADRAPPGSHHSPALWRPPLQRTLPVHSHLHIQLCPVFYGSAGPMSRAGEHDGGSWLDGDGGGWSQFGRGY